MAIRVVTSGTTKIKKITRGPGSGTTVVKRVTVGVPTKIGQASTGAILNLDDVDGSINLKHGTYLRYDSDFSLFIHRPFDSDVKDLISTNTFTAGLAWEKSGDFDQIRTATKYVDSDQEEYTIRSTAFTSSLLELTLAYFSPSVTITGETLYWDQPATGFTAAIDNPDDFPTQYLDSISDITQLSGSVTGNILLYSAGSKSASPAGGVDWTQTISTNSNAEILSTTSDLTGGSASAALTFNFFNGDSSVPYTQNLSTDSFSTTWQNASFDLSFANLTGRTFLQSYPDVGYTATKNGVFTPANHTAIINPTGGTLSDSSASGTMTFTNVLHHSNNSGRSIGGSCTFVRAAGISTAGAYSVIDSATDTSISADFTYPSFWIFTASTGSPPIVTDIVSGTSYTGDVNTLLDQQRTFAATVNNTASVPQAFWFAVRSSASQPTSFQTGSGPGLLVDAVVTNGSVSLEPSSPPAGYSAEAFSLYGITLNPGNTYVSIS